jgi:hypothetical protein
LPGSLPGKDAGGTGGVLDWKGDKGYTMKRRNN